MDKEAALQIVLDLARQNAITKFDDNADEMAETIADQKEAISIVENMVTKPITPDFLQAVKSLVSDIESMQERPQTYPESFGPFTAHDADVQDIIEDLGVTVEWPNLAISLAEVKKQISHFNGMRE